MFVSSPMFMFQTRECVWLDVWLYRLVLCVTPGLLWAVYLCDCEASEEQERKIQSGTWVIKERLEWGGDCCHFIQLTYSIKCINYNLNTLFTSWKFEKWNNGRNCILTICYIFIIFSQEVPLRSMMSFTRDYRTEF